MSIIDAGTYPLETDIHFIIPVPDWEPQEATVLQGFSYSLCKNAGLIRLASFYPSSIFDYADEGRANFIARRIAGVNPVYCIPQSPRAIKSIPLPAFLPYTILLLGEDQNPKEYADWVSQSEIPATIVATNGGDISYKDFDLETLKERFLSIDCRMILIELQAQ